MICEKKKWRQVKGTIWEVKKKKGKKTSYGKKGNIPDGR